MGRKCSRRCVIWKEKSHLLIHFACYFFCSLPPFSTPSLVTSLGNFNYDFKLIGITETGIRDFPPIHQSIYPITQYTKQKPQLLKGGTALYVLNSLVHTERADLNHKVMGFLNQLLLKLIKVKKEYCLQITIQALKFKCRGFYHVHGKNTR